VDASSRFTGRMPLRHAPSSSRPGWINLFSPVTGSIVPHSRSSGFPLRQACRRLQHSCDVSRSDRVLDQDERTWRERPAFAVTGLDLELAVDNDRELSCRSMVWLGATHVGGHGDEDHFVHESGWRRPERQEPLSAQCRRRRTASPRPPSSRPRRTSPRLLKGDGERSHSFAHRRHRTDGRWPSLR
jgi:hypothetical protein